MFVALNATFCNRDTVKEYGQHLGYCSSCILYLFHVYPTGNPLPIYLVMVDHRCKGQKSQITRILLITDKLRLSCISFHQWWICAPLASMKGNQAIGTVHGN